MTSETPSIEKIESRAVVEGRSESPVHSVSSGSNSGKKTKKATIKAVVAAVAATQEMEDAANNLSGDHPYLSVLYKRIRSHRKKLEKIKTLEQAKTKEGKVLNAQQLELMSNKTSLEKLVVELEMLREQFLVVFRQEGEQKLNEETSVAAVASVASVAATDEEVAAVEEMKEEKVDVQEQKDEEKEEKEEVQEQKQQVDDFANVFELLKTLHVVNLHQALGKEVPMVLDFFSKVLLGNTRPPAELSYEENLMESLEEAKKYLTESDKVFACDTTYSGLRAFVDQLVTISSGKNEQEETEKEPVEEGSDAVHTDEVEEETPDIPLVPEEINTMPEISFFADSQLEEQSDRTVEHAETIESQEEVQGEMADEINEGVIEERVEVATQDPVATVGVESECVPSPSTSTVQEKKEAGSEDNSPRGKNSQRRRGQNRWREKSSNSNGDKSGNGSPTNGEKPRRPRKPRTNDENSSAQGDKRSGFKEGRRARVDRALRKQGTPSQQPTAPMIAPNA